MTDAEKLREMATQQMRQAAEHQVLGRDKRVEYHRNRAYLFRRAANALERQASPPAEVKP